MGFGKKEKSGFSIHRSEEVVPHTLRHLVRQSSSLSSNEGWPDDDQQQPAAGTSRAETGARALLLSTSLNASSSSSASVAPSGGSPRRAGFQIGPPSSVESADDKDGYDANDALKKPTTHLNVCLLFASKQRAI